MKRIDRAIEISEELNMSIAKITEMIGISPNAFSVWTQGKRNPRESSLQKVQKFIDKYENGTLSIPKPKQETTMIKEIKKPRVKLMYQYIHALEKDYKHLRNVPDDNPTLLMLKEVADD